MHLSIGDKVLSWEVIEFGEWSGKIPYIIMKHSCGNTRKFQESEIRNKKFKKCKKCEARVSYRKNANDIVYRNLYRQYKHSAKKRNILFDISYEYFVDLIQKECKYCGRRPFIKREITKAKQSVWHEGENVLVNGVDRINNNKGYEKNNCAPCCKVCNMAKSTMSVKEWKKMIKLWNDNLESL